jgi:hypothetical protein
MNTTYVNNVITNRSAGTYSLPLHVGPTLIYLISVRALGAICVPGRYEGLQRSVSAAQMPRWDAIEDQAEAYELALR